MIQTLHNLDGIYNPGQMYECDVYKYKRSTLNRQGSEGGGGDYINERHTAKMLILLKEDLSRKNFKKSQVSLTQFGQDRRKRVCHISTVTVEL